MSNKSVVKSLEPPQELIDLARAFHDRYEELAPAFGYETREDTRQFDPESRNGRLMMRVIEDLYPRLRAALAQPQEGDGMSNKSAADEVMQMMETRIMELAAIRASENCNKHNIAATIRAAVDEALRAALAQPQEVEVELKRVAEHLRQNQVDLPPEFAKVLRENYWDLLIGESPAQSAPGREWPAKLRLTELLREAANALEACHAANEDLLSKRAAPPQDEARELLAEAIFYVQGDAESGYEGAVQLHKRIRAALAQPQEVDIEKIPERHVPARGPRKEEEPEDRVT